MKTYRVLVARKIEIQIEKFPKLVQENLLNKLGFVKSKF